MNPVSWCSNMLRDQECQVYLEEKVALLVHTSLSKMVEYRQEKAIKLFAEGIVYLESLLQHQEGIHPTRLDLVRTAMEPDAYRKKEEYIRQVVKREIDRNYRHMVTVLN